MPCRFTAWESMDSTWITAFPHTQSATQPELPHQPTGPVWHAFSVLMGTGSFLHSSPMVNVTCSSSLEMLSYWHSPLWTSQYELSLTHQGSNGFLMASWVFNTSGPGWWCASGFVRDPIGTLTTCCTVFCPVAGLTYRSFQTLRRAS